MIRIIVADDHSMVREGLVQLLQMEADFNVVGETSDGLGTLQLLNEIDADILLLDINMPNMNGIEVLKEIKKNKINIKVLIMTIHNEVEYLMNAVEIGCDGYILKDADSNLLKKAIRSVMDGEVFIQPSLTNTLNVGYINSQQKYNIELLTSRELEVLVLIAEGLLNKEIADKLNISERTVKNHITNIFKKIDVSDRTQAAVFAIKNNLVRL